jgi:hypothetical protein
MTDTVIVPFYRGVEGEAIAAREEHIPEMIYMCPICGTQHKDTSFQVPGTGSHACSEDHYMQAIEWIRNRPADAGR